MAAAAWTPTAVCPSTEVVKLKPAWQWKHSRFSSLNSFSPEPLT